MVYLQERKFMTNPFIILVIFQKGDEQGRIERPGGNSSAVWGLTWVPSPEEGSEKDMLCVADWGQTLSFYNLQGKQV